MKNIIEAKLKQVFSPKTLVVKDVSDLHIGHSGYRQGGNSHFEVILVSDKFIGISLVERHKNIYALLADELQAGLHALAIKAYTINEFSSKEHQL